MFKLSLFTINFLLLFIQSGFAQEIVTGRINNGNEEGVEVISSNKVVFSNTNVKQNGRVFTIDFDVASTEGLNTDIRYGIALTNETGHVLKIFDEKVYEEALTIGTSREHRTVAYQVPDNFSGNFVPRLISKTGQNIPIANISLKNVVLESSKLPSLFIDDSQCSIVRTLNGVNSEQSVHELFVISKDEKLSLVCEISNTTNRNVALSSVVVQKAGGSFGDRVAELSTSTGIVIAPQESKKITVTLPDVSKAQAYQARVVLKDINSNIESNSIAFRYYVEGVSYSLRKISIADGLYIKGSAVEVSFMWSGFDGSSIGSEEMSKKAKPETFALLSVIDANTKSCSEEVLKKLDTAHTEDTVTTVINKKCVNPSVILKLVDGNKNILDEKKVTPPVASVQKNGMVGVSKFVAIALILIGVLSAFIYFLRKRFKKEEAVQEALSSLLNPIVTALILFIVISVATTGKVSAASGNFFMNYILPTPGFFAATTIFANFGTNKDIYAPGELIQVGAMYGSDDNPMGSRCLVARAFIIGNGSTGDMFPGCFTAQNLREVVFTVGSMAAPNIPGTYTITFAGGSDGYGGKNDSDTITVVAPPPTPPTVNLFSPF